VSSSLSIPAKLDLKRDEKLDILWKDGTRSVYSLSYLQGRDPHDISPQPAEPKRKTTLNILPGNYAQPLTVKNAQLVGNYAIQIDWSDDHGSGIYSFEYLRSISPVEKKSGEA
jgi:DUF971 family protein